MSIKLMDSSVRDGGNVNDWQFGNRTLKALLQSLVYAGVDVVEVGYLKNTEYNPNRSLYNSVSEAKLNIPKKQNDVKFSLMVQEDKWDWNKIEPCDGTIEIIRVSFHKTDISEGLDLAKLVMDNGYICHINPINIMGYSDGELIDLIDRINLLNPDTFTIVDTFGSMELCDLKRISYLIDNNLAKHIKISSHLHENLGLAYSLAQVFCEFFECKRDVYIDASLNGIGRVPGNLCMEIIMRYLIKYKNAKYDIDYIYDAIDDYITPIKEKNPWGYSVAYALSATYNLHRTYPEFLLEREKLKSKDIRAILESIVPEERVIYNKEYIQKLYDAYLSVKYEDDENAERLCDLLNNKNIMILAPGYSIEQYTIEINKTIKEEKCVVISTNFIYEKVESNIVFFTSPKRYLAERNNIKEQNVIMTSNMLREKCDINHVLYFDYERLTLFGTKHNTDSVLMLLKLLESINCNKIYLAGFDGYSSDDNYYDNSFGKSKYTRKHTEDVQDIITGYFSNSILKLNSVTPTNYLIKKLD